MAKEIRSSEWEAEVVQSAVPVLVDVFGTYCPPCRALAPTLDALGVRVQVVCPGGVDTAIVAPDMKIPGRTFARPAYLADAVVHAIEAGKAGDVWVALREGTEPFTYTYAPIR